MNVKGKLFIVALPIGYIEDITLRAFRILNQVDIVAAEDTRSFRRFYQAIQQKLQGLSDFIESNVEPLFQKIISYHEHNEASKTPYLLKALQSQRNVALVSEAGTPHISDPGHKIIKQCYQYNIPVIPIPGASALTAALSISPYESGHHYFIGFPPKKAKDRDQLFQTLSSYDCHLVAFESPHRLSEHLQSAQKHLSNRSLCIQREITKPFEEVHLYPHPCAYPLDKKPKGEFVIIYSRPQHQKLKPEEAKKHIDQLIKQNKTSKEIAKQISSQSVLNRSEAYRLTENLKKSRHS